MTDHPQAAVKAMAHALFESNSDGIDGCRWTNVEFAATAILDTIAPLLTAPLQAELDAAYAEAHACGAERETWENRAESAEVKLRMVLEVGAALAKALRETQPTSHTKFCPTAEHPWSRCTCGYKQPSLGLWSAIKGETK